MMSVLTARLYWFAMVVAVGVILIAPTWSAMTRAASATTRCDDEHPGVPAVVQCRPAGCHVTGRPDGRDRESRPVGESPRWP